MGRRVKGRQKIILMGKSEKMGKNEKKCSRSMQKYCHFVEIVKFGLNLTYL